MPFQVRDLHTDLLDLLILLFLLFSLQGYLVIALLSFLLESIDLVHLIVGHPECSPILTSLVKDLTDKLLAFLDQLLLSFIRRLQVLIDLLVLLAELVQLLAFQVLVQEFLEFALNLFEGLCFEAKCFDFFGSLGPLVGGVEVHLAIIDIVVHFEN